DRQLPISRPTGSVEAVRGSSDRQRFSPADPRYCVTELRGPLVEVGDETTANTRYGERDIAELTMRPDGGRGDPVTLTRWGKWAETAEYAREGMDVLALDVETNDHGDGYATTGDSRVVFQPDYLVNVTDVRSWVQCPRLEYLNSLSGVPLNYPVVK